jgi:5-methyltetrahydropteroyltriglutamate--homocysteine methyltransferase
MKRSTERILTTHTGSLPRPDDLVGLLEGRDQREARADPAFQARVAAAVKEIVQQQATAGVAVVNDGEMSKVGYSTYIADRVTGFSEQSRQPRPQVEMGHFPEYYEAHPTGGSAARRPVCVGPIAWTGDAQVQQDIANLKAATEGADIAEAFMTAASPGVVWQFLLNDYYPTHEAYVFAVADAMRHEYEAIVNAGFVLQLDCPDLAMGRHSSYAQLDDAAFRRRMALNIEALNHAVRNIPAERLRMHLCWGNYPGPHHCDVPLAEIIDLVWTAKPSTILFEAANPRHAHEWTLFERVRVPDGKVLCPGVIECQSNYIEHPELVAQRIERYARLVGRERVMAGVDCGFSIHAGMRGIDPDVVWAKLSSLAQGAEIATKKLWK